MVPMSFTQRRIVALWVGAIVGFAIPIFWLGVMFLFFNASQSLASDALGYLISLTCPPWRWNVPWPVVPVLNCALYALVVFAVFQFRRMLLRRRNQNN
jgi:hypothetical protein